MLVPPAAGDRASPGLAVPRELWAEGRPVPWKVWSHLADSRGSRTRCWSPGSFPPKGFHIGNGLGCRLPSRECPLAPPRWAGKCVRDCWAVAPRFRCVTCFWAEPGVLVAVAPMLPCAACVPWKLCHTHALHVPIRNLIFKNAPLYLVWGW